MQAQKAFDSPRPTKREAEANLDNRLNFHWPKGRTALPPKRDNIFTPLKPNIQGRSKRASSLLLVNQGRHFAEGARGGTRKSSSGISRHRPWDSEHCCLTWAKSFWINFEFKGEADTPACGLSIMLVVARQRCSAGGMSSRLMVKH